MGTTFQGSSSPGEAPIARAAMVWAARRGRPWPSRRIAAASAIVVAIAGGFVLVHELVPALLVVVLGVVLATAAAPALEAAARRRVPRSVSAAAVLAVVTAAALGAVVLAVPLVVAQLSRVAAELPALCGRAREALAGSSQPALARLLLVAIPADCAPSHLFPPLALLASGVRSADWIRAAVAGALGAILVAYAWALERPFVLRAALLRLPASRRADVRALLAAAERRVGAYVRGQGILSAIVGAFTFAAFACFGVPNAAALAGLGACLEVIPIVGPLSALAIALLATLPDRVALWPAIAGFAAAQRLLVDYALMPAIMGRSVGVHPLLVLGSLAVLGQLGGVLGAMVAVPLAAVLQLLAERLLTRPMADGRVNVGRDRAGRLRWQAALLSSAVRRLARRRHARVAVGVREAEEEIEALADAVCGLAARLSTSGEERGS